MPPNDRRSAGRTQLRSNFPSPMLLASADNQSCLGPSGRTGDVGGGQADRKWLSGGYFSAPIWSFSSSRRPEQQSEQPEGVFLARDNPGPTENSGPQTGHNNFQLRDPAEQP